MNTILKPAVALAALGAFGLAAAAAAQAPEDTAHAPVDGLDTHSVFLKADLGPGGFAATLDPETFELCYILDTSELGEMPTAAHIHQHENGRPTLTLETPVDGLVEDCVMIDPGFAIALQVNPQGYFVNVHTASQPAGAAQGTLAIAQPE